MYGVYDVYDYSPTDNRTLFLTMDEMDDNPPAQLRPQKRSGDRQLKVKREKRRDSVSPVGDDS